MHKLIAVLVFLMLIASCSKTSTTVVPGNVPPPDHTIDSSTINIYIGKCYINMLGRKPVGGEQSSALVMLRKHNFSVADRQAFIQTLFTKLEYNRNLFSVAASQYLRNLDSATIVGQIELDSLLLTMPQNAMYFDLLRYENARLDTLRDAINYMNAGTMDYKGLLKHVVSNYFYDQINMGTQNFVISTYQNFLFRFPDSSEVLHGAQMVNGITSEAFLQIGQTKQNYIDIFFNSGDYYEGQVRFIFKLYLFREPTAAESGFYAAIYKSNRDYKQLQVAVFSLDEFAGIH